MACLTLSQKQIKKSDRVLGMKHAYGIQDVRVRFQVLTAASMKFGVFSDVAPCSHVEVDRRFRGAYCIIMAMNDRPDDGGSTNL
jgi:hypothetical protein